MQLSAEQFSAGWLVSASCAGTGGCCPMVRVDSHMEEDWYLFAVPVCIKLKNDMNK